MVCIAALPLSVSGCQDVELSHATCCRLVADGFMQECTGVYMYA